MYEKSFGPVRSEEEVEEDWWSGESLERGGTPFLCK